MLVLAAGKTTPVTEALSMVAEHRASGRDSCQVEPNALPHQRGKAGKAVLGRQGEGEKSLTDCGNSSSCPLTIGAQDASYLQDTRLSTCYT